MSAVDLELAPGRTVELRGPNGGGKSTLLRLLAGACQPSRGTRTAARGLRIGYAPESFAPPPLTARAFLGHHVRLRGGWDRDRRELAEEVEVLAARLACDFLLGERMPALSKGSLRKIVLVQALLGSPDLLVLDEGFDGLDREAQEALRGVIAERRESGTAVALSDHHGEAGPADLVLRVAKGTVGPEQESVR